MPQQEIDKVTTPGGITLKGLEAMARDGFEGAVRAGCSKAGRTGATRPAEDREEFKRKEARRRFYGTIPIRTGGRQGGQQCADEGRWYARYDAHVGAFRPDRAVA
ncbi:MAG: pyrroline-5-carboxylate reductase dimerization domain-containing protein [Alistipes sp.]